MRARKYRKNPIIIEAIQWLWSNWDDLCDFVPVPDVLYIPDEEARKQYPNLRIKTLEGEHIVSYGDWIVKGVKGEYYPVKPDIFEITYEEISDIKEE